MNEMSENMKLESGYERKLIHSFVGKTSPENVSSGWIRPVK